MKLTTASLLVSVSVLALSPAAVHAQDAAPQAAQSGQTNISDDNIGDIVGTAQRRGQKLSDVGMSISAVDSSALQKRNVTDAGDLAKLVPGLSVSDSGFSTPIYTLRGVGVNEPSIGTNSSVAVYVDEVGLPFPVMTQGAQLDLQRVEVLKGPQGTLYGQNSTGGAINYIANKPTDQFEAGISATFGRFNRGNVEGFLSGPLSSTLKARVAGRANFGGDWQQSISRPGDGLGKIENYTGRMIVDWEPSDRFRVSFNANGWVDKSDTVAPQLLKVFPSNSLNVDRNLVVLDTNPANCTGAASQLSGCPINANTGQRITAANAPVITRPSLLGGNNARLADWDAGQDFIRDDNFWQTSLRADFEISDELALTSITSYAELRRKQNAEFDGTAVSQGLRNFQVGSISTFGQEVRRTADFSGVHWLLGANYEKDKTSDNVLQYLRNASAVQSIAGRQATGSGIHADQSIENWAVFTSIDIPLTSQLTVSGGIRLSQDTRKFAGCGYVSEASNSAAYTGLVNIFRGLAGLAPIAALQTGQCFSIYAASGASAIAQSKDTAGLPVLTPGLAHRTLKQDNVPWNINVNFKPTDRSLIYARVSKGYKAGNFSTLNTADNVAYNPVVQEELTAYEVGARFSLPRVLQFEAALFQYDYINKQVRARINVGPPFGNINGQDSIPKSRLKGAEATITLRPVTGLTLTGSGTYIDSKVLEYFGQTVISDDGVNRNFSGSRFNFTPKWSLNGDLNYTHPITDRLNAFVGANLAYRSETSAVFIDTETTTPQAYDAFKIPAYTLVDGQLGVESSDGHWRAFIWGKNIFNKFYVTNVIRVADVVVRFPGMPATYGATVSYKF